MLRHILFFCALFNSSVLGIYFFEDHFGWYTTQKPQLEHFHDDMWSEEIKNSDEENVTENIYQESDISEKTESSIICLEDESLISYNDLKQIVNYLTDNLQTYKSMNNSYYDIAIDIRDRYIREIDDFEKWFQGRPQHLKHILDELARNRHTMEPYINEISTALYDYPYLYNKYNEELDSTNAITDILNTQKQICQLTCKQTRTHMLVERSSLEPSIENNLEQKHKGYCGTIDGVIKYITEELEKHAAVIEEEMKRKVDVDNESYNNKIINMKNSLKDLALNDFGRTMYDILNLQDEYYHFYHSINNINIKKIMSDINQNIARIKPRLMDLEADTKQFGIYCRNCNDDRLNLKLRSHDSTGYVNDKSNDILDQVITEKITEINEKVDADYRVIFKELDDKIDLVNLTDNYLINLKPLQDEIASLTSKESDYLDFLKHEVSKSSMDDIFILLDNSKKLLNEINREIEYIAKFIVREDTM